ncbi:MAG: 2-5 ligase [Ramlibacter sp.]|nr:2-5 ligase [Ramlibacter sp.]
MPTRRLFLGLWPTPEQRDAVQAHADAWQWPDAARRTRIERLHLTLHFIGSVHDDVVGALKTQLEVPWPGCELLLDEAQVWPGGIAVLEASQVPPALQHLHEGLQARLLALGLPVETRRYRPHVTLARKAFGAKPPPAWEPLRWTSSGYTLVESLPGGRGYVPLQCFG